MNELRQAFEKWVVDRPYIFSIDRLNAPPAYDDWVIQLAWEAYQAAHTAATAVKESTV